MTSGMASTSRRKSQKDLVTRLTDAGEDALQRIAELPGGQRAVGAFNDLRNRVDDLSKKVRGIDELEARVAKLERELASLKREKTTTPRRSAARRSST
jgi:phage shock protein A